jgi:hypothetical protein
LIGAHKHNIWWTIRWVQDVAATCLGVAFVIRQWISIVALVVRLALGAADCCTAVESIGALTVILSKDASSCTVAFVDGAIDLVITFYICNKTDSFNITNPMTAKIAVVFLVE